MTNAEDHLKFKKILTLEQIKNRDFVKAYLDFTLKKRRPKKCSKVYINLVNLYSHYPNLIKQIIANIPKLGYYKDYIWILYYSKNFDLDDYIYDLILNIIKKDLDNHKKGLDITTMGKWLPRENKKIDKKIHFVRKFTELLYPNLNGNTAKKNYRKMKTMFNKKLGTIESKICTKQYDSLDFKKIPPLALKRNMKSILKNEVAKKKYDSHIYYYLLNLNLSDFIFYVINKNCDEETIQKIWHLNKFNFLKNITDRKDLLNSVAILDLSADTFNQNCQWFAIGVSLLIDEYSQNSDYKLIVCNNQQLNLNQNLVEKAKMIMKYCSCCKYIDIAKYCDLIEQTYPKLDNIVILSTKDLKSQILNNNSKSKIINIKLSENCHKITHYIYDFKNKKIKISNKKIMENKIKKSTENIILSRIIHNSSDLKNRQNLKILGCGLFLLILQFLTYYFIL